MSTYDFDLALARHAMWVTRLKLFVAGVGETDLTAEKAVDSTACELGCWMAAAGEQYRALPGFQRLEEVHRHFHQTAGELVRLHLLGDETEVRLLLENVLPLASEQVNQALQALRTAQG